MARTLIPLIPLLLAFTTLGYAQPVGPSPLEPQAESEDSASEELPPLVLTPYERARLQDPALAGQDPLKRYRRADGTLKWGELSRSRALREAGGMAHFGMALFLKEVAVVAATGDRARIEEFFDGLMSTDFYKHYGLFVAGARVGEVAYVRYLQRYVKPQFVNGILKNALVLGAGLALPMIAEGNFSGKALVISLGSLGLSNAAVTTATASIKWVFDLRKARQAGTLARHGLATSRMARLGGWFYTAAELAVVLYLAEEISGEITKYVETQKAKDTLREAGQAFFAKAGDPQASAEEIAQAADDYHQAWIDYRDFLYTPVYMQEATYANRLKGLAREAKIFSDRREAAVQRLNQHAAIKDRMVARYGSIEAYADALIKKDQVELDRKANMYTQSYLDNLEKGIREVYHGGRREGGILEGLEDASWRLLGGAKGAEGDPYAGRTGVFASLGRRRAASRFAKRLESVSTNRLQAYEDESAILKGVAAALREQGRGPQAAVLDDLVETVARTHAMDRQLVDHSAGIIQAGPPKAGAAQVLERMGARR